ncbi:tyrosyl-DNA phosphodiesterase 2-like isoform X2 [Pristis pectinata]|uniref:tyrosyl-DNA phosphodiesterase 2-like isoform X2 n=1 Tax=Pristis pectinata TaxID=685728 RepID=UPI00223D796F|nr:tyrosyl-DNA phosphodiesterase 2-like isoform X2 [Pristis pectinata]
MSEPQCKRPRLSGSDCQAAASPQIDGEEEEKEDEGVLRRCREAVCAEFAVVTGTDESVAQCYLAKNEWLLERALNSYFEAAVQPSCSAMEAASQLMNGADFQRWYNPDIVFLQEVIEPYYNYLKKRAVSYTLIPANNDGYYTTIMLKKSRVKLLKQEIIAFPTTTMMRNLLIVQANIAGNELCLMTSHLESTKEHSRERIKQLGTVLKKMREVPDCATVIFGGDTNLRDKEVKSFGGLPANISDVWEFLNKPEHCRYTWDTTTNNNLKASYACRLRFDRVFFRASKEGQIVPKEMSLMGQDKLECGRFCSDHWGLLCDFDVIL